MSKPQKAPERGSTTISVRMDNDLIAWIDSMAKRENRTRANFVETTMKQARAAMTADQPTEEPKDVLAVLRKPLV